MGGKPVKQPVTPNRLENRPANNNNNNRLEGLEQQMNNMQIQLGGSGGGGASSLLRGITSIIGGPAGMLLAGGVAAIKGVHSLLTSKTLKDPKVVTALKEFFPEASNLQDIVKKLLKVYQNVEGKNSPDVIPFLASAKEELMELSEYLGGIVPVFQPADGKYDAELISMSTLRIKKLTRNLENTIASNNQALLLHVDKNLLVMGGHISEIHSKVERILLLTEENANANANALANAKNAYTSISGGSPSGKAIVVNKSGFVISVALLNPKYPPIEYSKNTLYGIKQNEFSDVPINKSMSVSLPENAKELKLTVIRKRTSKEGEFWLVRLNRSMKDGETWICSDAVFDEPNIPLVNNFVFTNVIANESEYNVYVLTKNSANALKIVNNRIVGSNIKEFTKVSSISKYYFVTQNEIYLTIVRVRSTGTYSLIRFNRKTQPGEMWQCDDNLITNNVEGEVTSISLN